MDRGALSIVILSLIHDASSLMNGMILHITQYMRVPMPACKKIQPRYNNKLWFGHYGKKSLDHPVYSLHNQTAAVLSYNAKNPITAKLQQFCRPSFKTFEVERFRLVAMLRFPFNHLLSFCQIFPLSYIAYISQIKPPLMPRTSDVWRKKERQKERGYIQQHRIW
jgi:hypothetical protein